MKSQSSRNSAVALVLVLGFLVIISALAVAFFASVTTELRASRNFQSNVTTRQLQDSVVNLVEGQLRQATVADPSDKTTLNRGWASQPGGITVFGDGSGGASSSILRFYKLYSSDAMTVAAPPDANHQDYVQTWDQSPALFTDLNAPIPVQDPAGGSIPIPRFPIIDPRANDLNNPEATIGINKGNLVEGFMYPVTGTLGVNEMVPATGTNGINSARLPMPVRWIYVLKDGTLTVPSGTGTGSNANIKASFSGSNFKPSQTNPIVGRVAFWTDDDTSKLNVNVAAGSAYVTAHVPNGDANSGNDPYSIDQYAGSFWDTPRVNSTFDQGQVYGDSPNPAVGGMPLPNAGGLASVQMLQNEFQRYPGHPATTSLALVFQQVLTSEQLYDLSPRIKGGDLTSKGGTHRHHIGGTVGNPMGASPNAPVPLRFDRLYDSVDEMLFAPVGANATPFIRRTTANYVQGMTPTSYTGANVNDTASFTPGLLDRFRFFLTAYNRAPDLNLFGHPRISVWPVRSQGWTDDNDPTKSGINGFDSLTLFCSTIGPSLFNYPKNNSDVPSPLNGPYHYSFFRREPTVTAATGAIVHDASHPYDIDIPRNAQLLTYLQSQLSQNVPGFGGNFVAKYGQADMDETLVEMFDYIRVANLYDSTITNTQPAPANVNPHAFSPKGIVMPSVGSLSGNQQLGMGRFPTICEATVLFYYAGSDMTVAAGAPSTLYPKGNGDYATNETITSGKNLVRWPPAKFDAAHPNLGLPDPTNQTPKTRYMRAAMFFSTFNPMQGYGPIVSPIAGDPKVTFEVSDLDQLTVSGGNVVGSPKVFGSLVSPTVLTLNNVSGDVWGGRNFGGFEGFMHTLAGYSVASPYPLQTSSANKIPLTVGPPTPVTPPAINYDFREATPPTFNLNSGKPVTVTIKYGGVVLQTIKLNFPSQTALPAPRGDDIVDAELLTAPVPPATVPTLTAGTPTDSAGRYYGPLRRWYWGGDTASFDPNASRTVPGPSAVPTNYTNTTRSLADARDFQLRINWTLGGSSYDPEQPLNKPITNWYGNRWRQIVQPGDTVRSLIFCDQPTGKTASASGDLRLAAVTNNITAPTVGSGKPGFYPHPDYASTTQRHACLLRCADGNVYFNYTTDKYLNSLNSPEFPIGNPFGNHVNLTATNQFPQAFAMGNLPRKLSAANTWINGLLRSSDNKAGDFDTGVGQYADGAFFNKQDEGNAIYAYIDTYTGITYYPIPYFGNGSYAAPSSAFTSPNRQMPSPVMMGSLLSRASPTSGNSWETLCFNPNPAGDSHYGNDNSKGPRDHVLLDLFQMPVVQPYPISEPFSTAGRVNLNFAIQPFDYIERSTALRAVLASERVTFMGSTTNTSNGAMYSAYKSGTQMTTNVRKVVDRKQTIALIKTLLAANGPFRSATQICEVPLVPTGWNVTTLAQARALWNLNGDLTGDNVREKPYADIYPRLTTKSNTYTIHMRVQTLRQVGTSNDFSYWDESRDAVLGEYRGSSSIERYIDPSDRRFNPNDSLTKTNSDFINPDTTTPQNSLEFMYRFRTVNTKLFAPY